MINILITGPPRVGKTTLLEEIAKESNKKIIGMITKEIRKEGKRIGFKIETFTGNEKILASKEYKRSKYKVGNYGVYLNNLDDVVEELHIELQKNKHDIIVIDEIGKMELYSLKFKYFILKTLKTKKLLGTIMLHDNKFTQKIKERTDTLVFNLTRENYGKVKKEVKRRL